MEHAKERGKVTEHMQYDADGVKSGCTGNCLCSVCDQTWKKVKGAKRRALLDGDGRREKDEGASPPWRRPYGVLNFLP